MHMPWSSLYPILHKIAFCLFVLSEMGGRLLPGCLCEKQLCSRVNSKSHIDLVHVPHRSYRCEICHSRFSTTDKLHYHRRLTSHRPIDNSEIDPLEILSEKKRGLKEEPSDIFGEEELFCDRFVPLESVYEPQSTCGISHPIPPR
jgi:hypothetical protein